MEHMEIQRYESEEDEDRHQYDYKNNQVSGVSLSFRSQKPHTN